MLMALSLTACAPRQIKVEPFRCAEPELKGNTWADVAVLALEQRDALKECNLKNGFPPVAEARRVSPASPEACREVGVAVEDGAHASGRIVESYLHPYGTAHVACEMPGVVGCAKPLGGGAYEIHFEESDNDWIWLHERCHALYREIKHTHEYNVSRGMP